MSKVALAARDRECAVAGCNRTEGLDIDHIVPVEEHGPTTHRNLHRICCQTIATTSTDVG